MRVRFIKAGDEFWHDNRLVWKAEEDAVLARTDQPDTCPNCDASWRSHTGSYCQSCGEPRRKVTVRVLVRFADGGSALRRWDDANISLSIVRPKTAEVAP